MKLLTVLALISAPLGAELLLHEPFHGMGNVVGGSGGSGFTGPWMSSGDTSGSATLSSFASSHSDGEETLAESGSAAFLEGNIGPLFRSASHPFANGDIVWFATRARWEGFDRQQSGFTLHFSANDLLLDFNTGSANDNNTGVIRLGNSSSPNLSPVLDTDFLLVAKIEFKSGAESITLWANPSLTGEPDPTGALVTASLELGTTFTGLTINSDGAVTDFFADELRLATTFAEAAPKSLLEPAVIDSFTAESALIAQGQETSLQWQTSHADSVALDQGLGNQAIDGSTPISPNNTTTYTLTAGNSFGETAAQTTIKVVTLDFSADKDTLDGSPLTLSWHAPQATSVAIDQGLGAQALTGTVQVNPTETTTYRITGTFDEGTVTREVTISTPAADPPNFLFIAIDDLKPICGFMAENEGNFLNFLYPDPAIRAQVVAKLTPNIDRLAATGIQFHRAYCSNAVCRPSRTALMSGFRPFNSGITGNADENIRASSNPAVANAITLSQNLMNNGWFTAGCGKIWHTASDQEADKAHSWDAWINPVPDYLSADDGATTRSQWSPKSGINPNSVINFGTYPGPAEGTEDYNNAEFIARVLEDSVQNGSSISGDGNANGIVQADGQTLDLSHKPFFLACGIFRPHLPFNCPQELADLFPVSEMTADQSTLAHFLADDNANRNDGDMADILAQGRSRAAANGLSNSEGEIRAYKETVRHYLGSVALADRCVGRLLDALENSEYADNTVVVLWSDHGWFLGEKYRWRKTTQWDEAANCVLLIRDPRGGKQAPGGTSCHRPVNLQDLYPTIMSLAGVDLPAHVNGYDISPLLTDPKRPWNIPALTTSGDNDHGLRIGEWSYLRPDDNVSQAKLFHLPSDPDERNDLANQAQYSAIKTSLNTLLNRVVAGDSFPERDDDSFLNWRLGYTSWPKDGDETDENQDPNGNGINNFEEYLRFGDGLDPASEPLPLFELISEPETSLLFPFRSTDPNLRYLVRESVNLNEEFLSPPVWDSDFNSFVTGVDTHNLAITLGESRKFWRLEVVPR